MNEALLEKVRSYRKLIEKAVQSLDDKDALKCICLYEKWDGNGKEYIENKKLRHNGKLWRVKQTHTSQADWSPDIAASLFDEINETNAGTSDDPIPYSGSMALEKGKYYSQDGVTYLCTRDTGIAVYNKLSELVGIYVEVAS